MAFNSDQDKSAAAGSAALPIDVPAASLAEELEEAITSPQRKDLEVLRYQLEALYLTEYKRAPQAVKVFVRSTARGSDLHSAHRLGELQFAQLVAAQAERRRTSKDFERVVLSGQGKRVVEALHQGRLSNKDLALRLQCSTEHLSRVLARLREEGVTDFVRNGTSTINFLTSAATVVFEDTIRESGAGTAANARVSELLQQVHDRTDKGFREFPSLVVYHGDRAKDLVS